MTRACVACGTEFIAQRSTRRFCSDRCRQRNRLHPSLSVASARELTPGPVYEATARDLEAAGRVNGSRGAMALVLALRIDSGDDNGHGMVAMIKEHGRILAEALKDAPKSWTPLDELRRRRAVKSRPAPNPRRQT